MLNQIQMLFQYCFKIVNLQIKSNIAFNIAKSIY